MALGISVPANSCTKATLIKHRPHVNRLTKINRNQPILFIMSAGDSVDRKLYEVMEVISMATNHPAGE